MKKIIFLIVIVVLLVLFWYFTPLLHGIKKNLCPDEWIINKMPGSSLNIDMENNKDSLSVNEGYYLTNGEHDFKDYNTTWVKFGCGVKPQIVW